MKERRLIELGYQIREENAKWVSEIWEKDFIFLHFRSNLYVFQQSSWKESSCRQKNFKWVREIRYSQVTIQIMVEVLWLYFVWFLGSFCLYSFSCPRQKMSKVGYTLFSYLCFCFYFVYNFSGCMRSWELCFLQQ